MPVFNLHPLLRVPENHETGKCVLQASQSPHPWTAVWAAGQSCFCPHCSAKVASTLSFPSSPPEVSGPEAGMSVALWAWSRGPSLQSRSSSSCLGQWGLLSALWKVTHNGNNPCVLRFYYIKPNYIGFHRFCSNHGLNLFFPLALILCLLHARSCAICCTDA